MRTFLFFALVCCALHVSAQPVLNLEQEERFMHLAAELRCLVCQNQSIADSNADLAVDLRLQIREQIAAGRSDEQIKAYMAERYGDFVLYRPPLKGGNWLLWFGPFVLLILATFVLFRQLRARRALTEAPQLSAEEHARAAALLDEERGER